MVRVIVNLESGAARFRVAVCAESIQRALELVGNRYSNCKARMVFPIDPESFFVRDGGTERVEDAAA